MAENNEIMTLNELANYLKVAEKTVVRMAREGKIPGTKVASQWRFMRTIVDDWLKSKMEPITQSNLFELIKVAPEVVPLSRLIAPDMMLMKVKSGSIDKVLGQMITPLVDKGVVKNKTEYLKLLLAREEIHSTAITKGVAIPHVRTPADAGLSNSGLVFGICSEGTKFSADSDDLTHIFILICSKDEVVHLQLLAKISRLLKKRNIKKRLLDCETPEQVVGLLAETEWEQAVKED